MRGHNDNKDRGDGDEEEGNDITMRKQG